jgi:hypothetical protein
MLRGRLSSRLADEIVKPDAISDGGPGEPAAFARFRKVPRSGSRARPAWLAGCHCSVSSADGQMPRCATALEQCLAVCASIAGCPIPLASTEHASLSRIWTAPKLGVGAGKQFDHHPIVDTKCIKPTDSARGGGRTPINENRAAGIPQNPDSPGSFSSASQTRTESTLLKSSATSLQSQLPYGSSASL